MNPLPFNPKLGPIVVRASAKSSLPRTDSPGCAEISGRGEKYRVFFKSWQQKMLRNENR